MDTWQLCLRHGSGAAGAGQAEQNRPASRARSRAADADGGPTGVRPALDFFPVTFRQQTAEGRTEEEEADHRGERAKGNRGK